MTGIERIRYSSRDPGAAAAFYTDVFDAEPTTLGFDIGKQQFEIVRSASAEEAPFAANETGFQHVAIVVADMQQAYAKLTRNQGWTPISLGGPQQLPNSSGEATAFKLRDPEGRPVELLQFPEASLDQIWRNAFAEAPTRVFFGVDHSAITVRDAAAAIAFWSGRGFVERGRQLNMGVEQMRLDGLNEPDVEVEVVSLRAGDSRPGVELLAYRRPSTIARPARDGGPLATELVISSVAATLRDPDGHRITVSVQSNTP